MQGHLDTSLNDDGIAQALVAATAMEKVPLTEAFSSDLKRAADVRLFSLFSVAQTDS